MKAKLKENKYIINILVLLGLLGLMMMNSFLVEKIMGVSDEEWGISQKQQFKIPKAYEDVYEYEQAEDNVKEEVKEYEINNEGTYVKEDTEQNLNEKVSKNNIKEDISKEKVIVESKPKNDLTPITTDKYVVKANDTLFFIAQRANTSVEKLKSINNITDDVIYVGEVLLIKSNSSSSIKSNNTNTEVASRGYREDDLYWLSRIIHAEAQGEPYEGKVAVGNVVLNRVKSNLFPNNIYDVVFDKQYGYVQFSPVIDGTIYNTPNRDSINAAKEALSGAKPVGTVLYFLNPQKATNFWIVENRKFAKTIGDHDFYH